MVLNDTIDFFHSPDVPRWNDALAERCSHCSCSRCSCSRCSCSRCSCSHCLLSFRSCSLTTAVRRAILPITRAVADPRQGRGEKRAGGREEATDADHAAVHPSHDAHASVAHLQVGMEWRGIMWLLLPLPNAPASRFPSRTPPASVSRPPPPHLHTERRDHFVTPMGGGRWNNVFIDPAALEAPLLTQPLYQQPVVWDGPPTFPTPLPPFPPAYYPPSGTARPSWTPRQTLLAPHQRSQTALHDVSGGSGGAACSGSPGGGGSKGGGEMLRGATAGGVNGSPGGFDAGFATRAFLPTREPALGAPSSSILSDPSILEALISPRYLPSRASGYSSQVFTRGERGGSYRGFDSRGGEYAANSGSTKGWARHAHLPPLSPGNPMHGGPRSLPGGKGPRLAQGHSSQASPQGSPGRAGPLSACQSAGTTGSQGASRSTRSKASSRLHSRATYADGTAGFDDYLRPRSNRSVPPPPPGTPGFDGVPLFRASHGPFAARQVEYVGFDDW